MSLEPLDESGQTTSLERPPPSPSDAMQTGSRPGTSMSAYCNIPERPDTALSLSDLTGQSQDSMTAFVGSYMTSILKPFAANLEELHNTVFNLAGSLRGVTERSHANTASLSQHSEFLARLQADLDRKAEQASQMQDQLSTTTQATAALEAQHQETASKVEALSERLAATCQSLEELTGALKDTRSKVAKCQDVELRIENRLSQTQEALEHLTVNLNTANEAIEENRAGVSGHGRTLQDVKQQLQALAQRQDQILEDQKAAAQDQSAQLERRLRTMDDRSADLQRQIQLHHEQVSKHESTIEVMLQKQEGKESLVEASQERLNKMETGMTDFNVSLIDLDEKTSKLAHLTQEFNDRVRGNVSRLESDMSSLTTSIRDMQAEILGDPPQTPSRLFVLSEDVMLNSARAARLEDMFELPPMTKESLHAQAGLSMKNGIMLTEKQISEFRECFTKFDHNGNGTLEVEELESFLRSMDFDPPMEYVLAKFEECDIDKSGELNFDEFCLLMTKCGSDPKISMGREIEIMKSRKQQEAEKEQRHKEMAEGMDKMKESLESFQGGFGRTVERLEGTDKRVKTLEDDHASLMVDVQKLQNDIQQSQDYWKGLSRGLKAAHKTVHREGEGEMLPNVHRLRSLPPLSPASPSSPPSWRTDAGNLTAR
eukprot:TRINITY_DN77191_c0_g1_i1.p1 TRINITY_DN77191_c0_g1~~TRINITY_DN77191_c0_g1_i1.p1  ORF type:complete len:657 (-),score=139.80 TRINITY_DN77191_c0_g1_i1:65-2035(-)